MRKVKISERTLRDLDAVLPSAGLDNSEFVSHALVSWSHLAHDALRYDGMLEEYIGDVHSRDVLQGVCDQLGRAIPPSLLRPMRDADLRFTRVTVPDERGLMARHWKIDSQSHWWWHRIPASGPIAEALAE